jgi:O-antigen/teichoic acid export membrane protein
MILNDRLVARALDLARDRGFLFFLANFVVGKGLAFFGPIALGVLLAPAVYGTLEFALAGALLIAMVATLGVPSAAMQLVLMRQGRKVVDLLGATAVVIGLAALLAAGTLWFFGYGLRWSLGAAFVALCATQQCGVAYARAHGRRNFNVWIDHAPTIAAVVVAAGLAAFGKGGDRQALLFAVSALGAVAMTIAGAIARRDLAPHFIRRMREAATIGLPMVGASLVGAWMVSSGRIYMGLFLSQEDVYAYAFTFRVASLLVLLHAVVVTAFAAQLYKMPTRRFDPIGAMLVGALAIGALLLILVAPERLAIGWFSPAKAALLTARPALALVGAQVFFWVASATAEMRVSRARGAGVSMQLNLIVSLCVGAALLLWRHYGQIGFGGLTAAVLAQQTAGCAAQHASLIQRGVTPRKTVFASLIGGAVVTVTALLRIWTSL